MNKLSEIDIKIIQSSLSWAKSMQEFKMFLRNLNSQIMYIIDSYTTNDHINWTKILDTLWITKKEKGEDEDDESYNFDIEKEKIITELVLEVLNSKKIT